MPLKRCSKDGQTGWKWGNEGTCYVGPGAREKALEQARAILANQGDEKIKDEKPFTTIVDFRE